MIYNYIREGRLAAKVDEQTGKKLIDREVAINFIAKRMAKQAEKLSQVAE
jgi:hypothetical protein